MIDRTGQVWEVWSGIMLIVGSPVWEDHDFVSHPCLSLEDGRKFTYAEARDGGFESSRMCERIA